MYPGMHTQQAALAKQRQQQEIQRQQQQQQMNQTPSLPQQAPASAGHRRDSSQRTNGSTKATDPMVEERISRLLNQMRHGSMGSNDNDTLNNSQSHFPRSKKPEEDMDEDERLLASEEGKKLSSKERRQLRNKVSARAFRSRRKGQYIKLQRNEHRLTEYQNTSLSSRASSHPKVRRMMTCGPKTTRYVRRTCVSPT
jgi:ribonuclease Z